MSILIDLWWRHTNPTIGGAKGNAYMRQGGAKGQRLGRGRDTSESTFPIGASKVGPSKVKYHMKWPNVSSNIFQRTKYCFWTRIIKEVVHTQYDDTATTCKYTLTWLNTLIFLLMRLLGNDSALRRRAGGGNSPNASRVIFKPL
jgi:hypothetical protein